VVPGEDFPVSVPVHRRAAPRADRTAGPPSRGTGVSRIQRKATRRRRRNVEELEPTQMTTWQPSSLPVPTVKSSSTRFDRQGRRPKLNRSAADIMRSLLAGEIITAVQSLSDDMIELYAAEVGATVTWSIREHKRRVARQVLRRRRPGRRDPRRTAPARGHRHGHVDHGKTLLLDKIRRPTWSREAGVLPAHRCVQGAVEGKAIAFIDTPGHEAFTAMRAGRQVTDIIISWSPPTA